MSDERIAIMVEAGVPRPAWKAFLRDSRGLRGRAARDHAGEAELRELRRRAELRAAPLGQITSSVSPELLPAGQIAAPWEPAQLDFAGTPLAIAPSSSSGPESSSNSASSSLELGLELGPQLELPWQQSRRDRFRLRDRLRAHAVSPRVAQCYRSQVAPTVDLCKGTDGRAFQRGLLVCGSVWSCPVCSAKIRAGRADEVQRTVAWHGQERTFLWSLTVKHARGHGTPLRELRSGVAHAMRLMQAGRQWLRFKQRVGLVGSIRALEVTHGEANSWHPHLHALLLVERPDLLILERAWLLGRWQRCVARALGAKHIPDTHGSDLRRCTDATYVAKLGLELTDGAKTGRPGHRSAWQLARDVAGEPDRAGRDRALWREYQSALFGARMLTWSRGLRRAAGLELEATDQELAELEVSNLAPVRLSRRLFRAIRGPDVLLALLEACEHGGRASVARTVSALFARRGRGRRVAPSRDGPQEASDDGRVLLCDQQDEKRVA